MTDDELKALFEASRAETRQLVEEARQLVEETRLQLGGAIDDSRRHFDVTAEGLRHEIRLVAEKVTGVDERLSREAADIRGEMRQGFADTQAMIKFSHAELDRRVTSLEDSRRAVEETVADLQARVERLEGSTH